MIGCRNCFQFPLNFERELIILSWLQSKTQVTPCLWRTNISPQRSTDEERRAKLEVRVFHILIIYSSINYKLVTPHLRLVPEWWFFRNDTTGQLCDNCRTQFPSSISSEMLKPIRLWKHHILPQLDWAHKLPTIKIDPVRYEGISSVRLLFFFSCFALGLYLKTRNPLPTESDK